MQSKTNCRLSVKSGNGVSLASILVLFLKQCNANDYVNVALKIELSRHMEEVIGGWKSGACYLFFAGYAG